MQDRFKFRVVYYNDVEKKYFIFEPDLISADGTARAYAYGESGADEYYDTVTLNQCTGLKDKNGKLIYEGDIVKAITHNPYEKHIGVIQFHTCYFSLDYINLGKYGEAGISLAKNTGDFVSLEIIGNIFQDKKLMNEA